MSTSIVVIHYMGWGFQSPNSQEIHCFEWEYELCNIFQERNPGMKQELPTHSPWSTASNPGVCFNPLTRLHVLHISIPPWKFHISCMFTFFLIFIWRLRTETVEMVSWSNSYCMLMLYSDFRGNSWKQGHCVYYIVVISYLWLLVGIIVLGFFSYTALLWAVLEVLYSVLSVCEERELYVVSRCVKKIMLCN